MNTGLKVLIAAACVAVLAYVGRDFYARYAAQKEIDDRQQFSECYVARQANKAFREGQTPPPEWKGTSEDARLKTAICNNRGV